jgi:hypothetical protein
MFPNVWRATWGGLTGILGGHDIYMWNVLKKNKEKYLQESLLCSGSSFVTQCYSSQNRRTSAVLEGKLHYKSTYSSVILRETKCIQIYNTSLLDKYLQSQLLCLLTHSLLCLTTCFGPTGHHQAITNKHSVHISKKTSSPNGSVVFSLLQ